MRHADLLFGDPWGIVATTFQVTLDGTNVVCWIYLYRRHSSGPAQVIVICRRLETLILWITSKSAAGVRPVAVLRGSSCRSFTEDSRYDSLQVRR
jgi:hypothetical protein